MRFNENVWLLLIPVLAVMTILLYAASAVRSRRELKKLLGASADDPEIVRFSRQHRFWRVVLLIAASMLLVIAIARPYWNTTKLPGGSAGRDVLVLFDVSRSMRATDVAPSRLEQAKYLLRKLAADLPQDRFGLIAFAGNAYLSCPLTADKSAFDEYVSELDTDTVPLGGTNIERALNVADRAFSAAEGDHRAVLLVTDGDELTGNAENAARAFAQKKIPIITVGLGDPAVGAPIPDGKGAMIRDKAGALALSKLNETKLAELSKLSGGIYVRSTTADPGIGVVENALAKLASRKSDGAREVPEERFVPFLLAAWILLLLSALIPERLALKKGSVLLLLFAATTLWGAEGAPEAKSPAPTPEALYNQALDQQRAGKSADAAKNYEEVMKRAVNDPLLQSRALFNSGVIRHQEARNLLEKAQQQLKGQQLDNALKELDSATRKLNAGSELYTHALSFAQADFSAGKENFTQLELDRRQIEELKKKIEELKKQQQKARNEAKKAQQQNQQKKDQKDQQQQQQQQQQQNQQARNEAEKLEKQAKELDQKELEKQAKEAKEELEKAQKAEKQQEKQQHLDKAVKALGEEKKEPSKQPQDQPQEGKKEEKKDSQQAPAAGKEDKEQKEQKERSGNAKLQLLNDEEKNLRDAIRNQRQMQRPQVEKDW